MNQGCLEVHEGSRGNIDGGARVLEGKGVGGDLVVEGQGRGGRERRRNV